jgi:hypothetical protein
MGLKREGLWGGGGGQWEGEIFLQFFNTLVGGLRQGAFCSNTFLFPSPLRATVKPDIYGGGGTKTKSLSFAFFPLYPHSFYMQVFPHFFII